MQFARNGNGKLGKVRECEIRVQPLSVKPFTVMADTNQRFVLARCFVFDLLDSRVTDVEIRKNGKEKIWNLMKSEREKNNQFAIPKKKGTVTR